MADTPITLDLLKQLLEHLREPQVLDSHDWQHAFFLQQYLLDSPDANQQTPGLQLALAVTDMFRQFAPASPPRRKKRIDTRWGEYGILAAQYFAPFINGNPAPRSLRDAWDEIDSAILGLIFPNSDNLDDGLREEYRLVADEPDAAPASTLSDWHRKGLEHFLEFIQVREQTLASGARAVAVPKAGAVRSGERRSFRLVMRLLLAAFLIALVAFLIWGGLKAYRVYTLGQVLLADLRQAQRLEFTLDSPETIDQAGQLLASVKTNLTALDEEVRPYLWLAPRLSWVPDYGGELLYAEPLLDMALALVNSADSAYQGGRPIAQIIFAGDNDTNLSAVTNAVIDFVADFQISLEHLDRAIEFRQQIDTTSLSPQIRGLIEEKLDPNLQPVRELLLTTSALPDLLGAANAGPQTYLLLLQNEDEYRATGGFITSLGTVTVTDGKPGAFNFEDVYDVDDYSQPYPAAPWQMQKYMDIPILVLRDANWYVDYPKTVTWVRYLYGYTRNTDLAGVIAVDQYAAAEILDVVGSVQVEGVDEPITRQNVFEYMRNAKVPPDGTNLEEWNRKAFVAKLASPLIEKLLLGDGFSWQVFVRTVTRLLDEKHILLQFDNPTIARLVAGNDWDGRVLPLSRSDYLMLIDSNVGYNKVNAVVERSFSYRVDLTHLHSNLDVTHSNHLDVPITCEWGEGHVVETPQERFYPIKGCYWNYLRVYTHPETRLLDSMVHDIPAEWTMLGEAVPARVDILEEGISGIQGFGTYLVVPVEESLKTGFEFQLSPSVIKTDADGNSVYTLKIQKQPGLVSAPMSLQFTLPVNAEIVSIPKDAVADGNIVSWEFDLVRDVILEIIWREK